MNFCKKFYQWKIQLVTEIKNSRMATTEKRIGKLEEKRVL